MSVAASPGAAETADYVRRLIRSRAFRAPWRSAQRSGLIVPFRQGPVAVSASAAISAWPHPTVKNSKHGEGRDHRRPQRERRDPIHHRQARPKCWGDTGSEAQHQPHEEDHKGAEKKWPANQQSFNVLVVYGHAEDRFSQDERAQRVSAVDRKRLEPNITTPAGGHCRGSPGRKARPREQRC